MNKGKMNKYEGPTQEKQDCLNDLTMRLETEKNKGVS